MKIPSTSVRWLRAFAIDVRALAAMRIIIGIVLLYDALTRFKLLRPFYTDAGAVPRGVFLSGGAKYQSFWSIDGSYGFAVLLLSIHTLLTLLLAIGYRTRIVSFLLAASMWSLINRNPTLSHGGNGFAMWMLIWSLFVPLNARASVDYYTARERPRVKRIASIATLGMLLQIAFVYWIAFAVKTDPEWRSDFTAIYWFMHSHLATPLGKMLGEYPVLTQILTVLSMGLEIIGPIFALITFSMPRTRAVIAFMFIAFHIGMVATMYVGSFSFLCIGIWLLYIPTPIWNLLARARGAGTIWRPVVRGFDALVRTIARVIEAARLLPTRVIGLGPRSTLVQAAIGVLVVYVCLVNFVSALPKTLASSLGPAARLPKLKQAWNMMEKPWYHFHVLQLEVELADGTRHQLSHADAPDGSFDLTLPVTNDPEDYWTFTTWHRQNTFLVAYRATLLLGALDKNTTALAAWVDYHRRKWNEFHPNPHKQVKKITVWADLHATPGPGGTRNMKVTTARHPIFVWPEPRK